MQVGDSLLLREVESFNRIDLSFVHIGGSLDFSGSTLNTVDMSGASVATDLRLANVSWHTSATTLGGLILRNARVTNLIDTMDAWPVAGQLYLSGFTFRNLGTHYAAGSSMRVRGADWWDQWLRRDPDFTPQLYEQFAVSFLAVGDR